MSRGLARLVGMDVLKTGATVAEEVQTLAAHWDAYDFFVLHDKDTDQVGGDGDFPGKVATLERLDAELPGIEARGGPTSSSSPGTTRAPPSSRATPGTRCRSSSSPRTPRPTRSSAAPSAPARLGASAPSPPTT